MAFWPILPWALLIGGGALAYTRIVPPLAGFALSMSALPAGIMVALGLGWLRMRGTPVPYFTALFLVSTLPAFLLLLAGRDAARYPRINDVTTDPAHPPEFHAIAALPENKGRDLSFPSSSVDVIRGSYPNLMPLEWPSEHADAALVFDAAVDVAEAQSQWEVLRVDKAMRTLEAVAESAIFRFRDYIIVCVTHEDHAVRINMRSKSRDGKSDLGMNARRIESFLKALNAIAFADRKELNE